MNGSARCAGAFAAFACFVVGCARDGSARPSDEQAGLAGPIRVAAAPIAPSRAEAVAPAIARTLAASARTAVSVELPARADRPFRVVDRVSGVGAAVRANGALPIAGVVGARKVRFAGAVAGAELVHAIVDDGAEDSIVLAKPPAQGVLRWTFEPTASVAGLRLVDGILELLDAHGAPRLRVDRPFTIDAVGKRRAASLEVEGCLVDRSPAPPWGRAFVPPAARCEVVVTFDAASPSYPVVVDPVWRATASMAVPRAHHVNVQTHLSATRLGVLVVGGDTPSAASSAEMFDPATATWATAASPPGSFVGEPVIVPPNWLFVGPTTAIYDDTTGLWIATAAPAEAHTRGATRMLPGGRALVLGGIDGGGAATSSVEIFDAATGTWTPGPALPEARFDATASLIAGKVLVVGGSASTSVALSSAYVFDPTALTWTKVASAPGPITRHREFSAATPRVLVFGTATYEYDVAGDVWKTLSTPLALEDAAMATASGASAVFAGGLDAATSALTTNALRYQYDAAGSSIALYGALTKPRRGAAATKIGDGLVLVSGGLDASGAPMADAEILSSFQVGLSCTASAECELGAYCVGGTCAPKRALGAFATDPASCLSGLVADGVCCDTACTGTCAACDLDASKGTCTAVAGAAKHGTCAAATAGDPCTARVCDGKEPSTCAGFVGAEIDCRDHACATGVETLPATCDGKGACAAVVTKTCSPYACDGKQCRSTCRGDADCETGASCDVTAHVCIPPVCIDDHTQRGPTGLPLDCTPFRCAKGACATRCTSSDECLSAFNCDVPSGRCVPASAAESNAPDSGGCAASSSHTGAGGLAAFGVALALVARRRRRR
jgi:uncharacterized protein (TIGR03382 family)